MSTKRTLFNSVVPVTMVLSLISGSALAAPSEADLNTLNPSDGVAAPLQQGSSEIHLKPYRVLLVSGTQMRDNYVIHDAADLGDIAALLKLWGVPFDILRLDTHSMTLSDFVDGVGQARYGTIIWTARQDEYPGQVQDYSILAQAVNDCHISLIAVGSRTQEPVMQGLLGLTYDGWGAISDPVMISGTSHFVTRGLAGASVPANEAFPDGSGPRVTITATDVITLAVAGTFPQLTARKIDVGCHTRAVWIGGQHDYVFYSSPTFIKLLRRALVWSLGYGIYKDYGNSVVLRMDDPGGASSAYLASWHYPQLSQATIQNSIIAPLMAHTATLGVGFNIGYPGIASRSITFGSPGIPSRSITHSVGIRFTDPYGTLQDVVSTAAGMRDGIAAGVLEVQSHGLTHMVPDLDTSIPGSTNWWDGSTRVEWPKVGWYREFYDTRRGVEVDAATQKIHLLQSADWTEQDFDVRPLAFIPGGHAISGDYYVESTGSEGTITITLSGASPNASYTTYYGNAGTTWTTIGTLTTGGNGDGQGVFGFSSGIAGTANMYFAVNRPGSGTQFISDLITDSLTYNFSSNFRDYTQMTPAERAQFYLATETFAGGSVVVGDGNHVSSHIADNYTYKLAGETGYGLGLDDRSHYLGQDHVVTLRVSETSYFFSTSALQRNFDRGVPAVSSFHDRDIADSGSNYLASWLNILDTSFPNLDYMSMDEWTGYMHAQLSATVPTRNNVQFNVAYDNYYDRYFGQHDSTWTLHLADELLTRMQALGTTAVVVDGEVTGTVDAATYFTETQVLTVPVGINMIHTVLFRPVSSNHAPRHRGV